MNYGNGYGYSQGPSQSFLQPNVSCTYGYSDAGVEAYPVAPGNSVIFFPVNGEQIMWIKSVDMSGRPYPIRSYYLNEREMGFAQAPQIPQNQMSMGPNMNEYVKKTEVEGMVNDIMNRNMSQRSMGMQGQGSYQQQNWSQGQPQMNQEVQQ